MKWQQWLKWLDEHILLLLGGFLIAAIPLYPKIPLFSPIEQYIVRVRLEDIAVAITGCVWLIQVLRKKVVWQSYYFWLIALYGVVGLLSVISAVLFIQTVPAQPLHLGKTLLHYFRYLEYFSLFFFVYSSIKKPQHLKWLLGVMVTTVLLVAVYGFGQKYYYWPVYSTMNREFSKGIRLVLTEHARVQSTFGGHYDLAAYLVIMLPLLAALGFSTRNRWHKVVLHGVHWTGIWLLILSASRTSFLAYLLGLWLVIALFAWKQQTWWQKLKWAGTRSLVAGVVIGSTMLFFGNDMYERLLQVLEGYPQLHDRYHALNAQRKWLVDDYLPTKLGFKSMSLPSATKPDNAIAIDELGVILDSDTRPSPARPSDVYEDIPDLVQVATISADGTWTTITVEKPRTFSDTALQKGLSLAIRLDTLWPQAIRGFMRDPLLGSGYATLNKESAYHFTEADSTDNNYLRTLGETGLLGFLSFYGLVAVAMLAAARHLNHPDSVTRALSVGYLGSALGLLVNALYIDVFAASKVAFTFWAVTGLLLAATQLPQVQSKASRPKKRPRS